MYALQIGLLLLFPQGVEAETPKFRECVLLAGRIESCSSGPYSGEVVRGEDGGDEAYLQRCYASLGRISSCSGPYSGTAVLTHLGSYHSCSVREGKVFWCDPTPYSGSSVVLY